MSFSEEKLTDGESGSLKKSKKKQKKKDAWRPEGPRDPFAMVCVSMFGTFHIRCKTNVLLAL